jgi:AraC family transcriptional regulator, regulatory protein of adaptative response / DNA-3-methyladenine glycosylase II
MAAMDAPTDLSASACYRALCARDARFDGHWFVGVSSTGIYCRPVCRVRTPKAENCHFFPLAAQAEHAGYRPCLKCRPELAPRAFSVMEASRSLAAAARQRLDADLDPGLSATAERLGITDRHLRRIFTAHYGVSPLQYQQTRRLLLAKQLLTDSSLAVPEVAQRAGFGSTRAFHSAWRTQYGLTPGQLRRSRTPPAAETALTLSYRPPYALAALFSFLAQRAVPGVEAVEPNSWRIHRTVAGGALSVQFEPEQHRLRVWLSPSLWPRSGEWLANVAAWLDVDADPLAIHQALQPMGERIPGLRLPGSLDRFETAVRALLGQQVTVAAARTIATRLVQRYGHPLPATESLNPLADRCFPSPDTLARADWGDVAALGMPGKRAQAIQSLAQHWPSLALAQRSGSPEAAQAELQQLPGIGPWTAAYMVMRGWPWPDVFLPGDVVLRQQMAITAALTPIDTAALAPYRSYAVLQLWARASASRAPATPQVTP